MEQLEKLNLFSTKISDLNSKIKKLSNLEVIDIRLTSITTLPSEIGGLKRLKEIQFHILKKPFPDSICNLKEIETLDGSFEDVEKPYPKEFGNLTNIQRLTVTHDIELIFQVHFQN